jgi:hypothetical protein
MTAITVVSASEYSNTLVYMVLRGKTTYWIQYSGKLPPYVSQRYFSKLGRSGERRVPDGKVRANLLAAIEAYKAQPLRERLCTPMTVGEASLAASSVI